MIRTGVCAVPSPGCCSALLDVTSGWIMPMRERNASRVSVIPSVLGMGLGALGIVGNILMLPHVLAGFFGRS